MLSKLLYLTLLFSNNQADNLAVIKDKFAGAILGSAIGDALARVTEFIDTKEEITKIYGPDGIRSFYDFKKSDFIDDLALYTDDTVMAKIVLSECIGKFDLNNLKSRFSELFGKDKYKIDKYYNYRAHGPTNINAFNSNLDINNISKEGGCGSVMRVWPIGLMYARDLEFAKYYSKDIKELSLFKYSVEQCILTHRHPMAKAACVAMAVGVASAINNYSVDQIIENMILAAENFDQEELKYKPHAKKITNFSNLKPELIAQDKLLTSDMIRYAYLMAKENINADKILGINNIKQKNHRSPNGFLLGWAADEAVAAAVYIFYKHHNNLKSALIESVNTPGDSDSIAALAGALVGAYSGLEKFNKNGFDYSKLENRKELLSLANRAAKFYLKILGL